MRTAELIYLLNEELAKVKADKKNSPSLLFIIRAYAVVVKKLSDNFHPNEQITKSRLEELYVAKQITKNMQDKLIVLIGKKIQNSPLMKKKILFGELKRITGIGPQKAQILIDKGVSSVADLKKPHWWNLLNIDTQTALATQPIKKIPYKEISKIKPVLMSFPDAKIQIVGSYRRKLPTSRDIDIMLVSASLSAMNDYLKYLDKKIPHIYLYSKGADKMSLVLEFDAKRKFKVDVFRTHPDFYWSHLLYATGSKENNVKMRGRAKKMGFLLNQKGMWRAGERVLGPMATEKEYYKVLGLPYLLPENR